MSRLKEQKELKIRSILSMSGEEEEEEEARFDGLWDEKMKQTA